MGQRAEEVPGPGFGVVGQFFAQGPYLPLLELQARWIEALIFGPMLPPRYRFDGPGARPDAPERFAEQLAASPRPTVDWGNIDALLGSGLAIVHRRHGVRRPGRSATIA